ncbi:MFS transporter [Marinimicrobium sp. C6131]|uniref:MFS transporter n=1 Tax=Marinimicrobium sp. C6131 TaxID=3022676 RepID=UPI00223D3805|nr:MFS transporter [Marinimicrobium sp. C6131]UZJ42887.1 MFS transporter [Marinimicrobium sp. C6131]
MNEPQSAAPVSPWWVLIAVCLGAFVAPLGMASVNVALPTMARELNASAVLVSWVPTIVLIANIIFMLPAGKLADKVGRKRVFLWGIGLNSTASALAFFVNSIEMVLVLRFFQGMGAAMMFATSMALLISVFPPEKRGLPLGLNAACVYFGLTLAPALGGWVTDAWGWRFVFLLPLPIVVLVVSLIAWRVSGDWFGERDNRFDWGGALTFALWAIALVIGLTGLPGVWQSAVLAFSFVLLAIFIRRQARREQPLIRVQMFRESRLFSFSLITALFMYASSYPLGFLLSLYLQYVRGYSAADAGHVLLVQALTMACVAPLAGRLSDYLPARWLASAGCFCTLCGYGLLSTLGVATAPGFIVLALFLVGLGFGCFSSPNNHVVMQSAHSSEVGVAAATLNLARVVGNLVGMSLVNLFVYWNLGNQPLNETLSEPLLRTFSQAMLLALMFLICATLISLLRGASGDISSEQKKPGN